MRTMLTRSLSLRSARAPALERGGETVLVLMGLLLLVGCSPEEIPAITGVPGGTPTAGTNVSQASPTFSTDPADKAECERQMRRISEVLREYQRRNAGQLPGHLSQLITQGYLKDESLLLCPFAKKLGRYYEWREDFRDEVFQDRLEISYAYEFIDEEHKGLRELGVRATLAEYKARQQRRLSDTNHVWVPVIRCLAHRPLLNCTLSGRIYESGMHWEDVLPSGPGHHELTTEALFSEEISAVTPPSAPLLPASVDAKLEIPARDPNTPNPCLDLTRHYNALLTQTWHPGHAGNDLRELGVGLGTIDQVEWDTRGVVQVRSLRLTGLQWPAAVRGMSVERSCRVLHFLHGTGFDAPSGEVIGCYRVHYADGTTAEIPIVYGVDVEDWWYDPTSAQPGGASVAWSGENDAVRRQGRRIRLYHLAWTNPRPELAVATVDLESKLGSSAPFLLAITCE